MSYLVDVLTSSWEEKEMANDIADAKWGHCFYRIHIHIHTHKINGVSVISFLVDGLPMDNF